MLNQWVLGGLYEIKYIGDYLLPDTKLMGKTNFTKTAYQRQRLEAYFSNGHSSFQKEAIIALGRQVGLTRQQVYKWLWDRKRAERQKVKVQPAADFVLASQCEYVPVHYRDYKIHVPSNKQQARAFHVRPEVTMWAVNVLRGEGWQLIRDSPETLLEERQSFFEEQEPSPCFHRVERQRQTRTGDFFLLRSARKGKNIFDDDS